MIVANNDILVLILSTTNPKYQEFKQAIRDTWVKDLQEHGVKCFFYEGGELENSVDGDTLKLNAPDDIFGVSKKLIAAIHFIFELHPQTKIIYRTNLSSYIDVNAFLRFIEDNQLDNEIYAGYLGTESIFRERFYQFKILYFLMRFIKFGKKIRFASGSGFFLGTTHCRKLLSSRVNFHLVDDIMVADTIKVSPSQLVVPLRLMVSDKTRSSIDERTYDQLVHEKNLFHYRFKTDDREQDAALLMHFGDKSFRRIFFTGNNNQ
jgi:hypothetical protein